MPEVLLMLGYLGRGSYYSDRRDFKLLQHPKWSMVCRVILNIECTNSIIFEIRSTSSKRECWTFWKMLEFLEKQKTTDAYNPLEYDLFDIEYKFLKIKKL